MTYKFKVVKIEKWTKAEKLYKEGYKLYKEGYKLYKEGYKLYKEGYKLGNEGYKLAPDWSKANSKKQTENIVCNKMGCFIVRIVIAPDGRSSSSGYEHGAKYWGWCSKSKDQFFEDYKGFLNGRKTYSCVCCNKRKKHIAPYRLYENLNICHAGFICSETCLNMTILRYT